MAKQYDIIIRLLMVGDSGVGKTCMLCRFADDDISSTHVSTIGIDFKIKTLTIDGKKIRIQIWDTAGQERYETITKQYYRRAQGIVLVYDMKNEESFKNIQKWMKYISDFAPEDVELILVANKSDAYNSERKVSKEHGEMFAKEHRIPFYETSAYMDMNINEAFIMLARIVMKRHKKEIDKQMEHIRLFCREDSDAHIIEKQGKDNNGCCVLM
ncbi:ras-related protein Rab-15-like [Saccoglossus kowalevskii]|uniref:Ras-related protein Rab-15-like n=1 Tax=Saccoglossus kowalevskii TaxID=10224 RepID=A0ABM0MXT4_SACKO|nr:PREDICTED: ras-related protein Rab-15-like [Saccoglossus kowalevskii]